MEVLAQSIYLGPGARPEQRLEAYDRLRRATRRVAILVDVARVRGQLPPAAARGLLLTNAALWHEVRRGDRRERRERAADRGAAVAPRPQPVASPARAGSSFDSEDDTRPDPLPRVAPTLILRAGR